LDVAATPRCSTSSLGVMRAVFFLFSAVVSIFGYATEQSVPPKASDNAVPSMLHVLDGLWTLRIENVQHKIVTTMTVRFAAEVAESCMGGQWKRVVVITHTSSDETFFPVTEPLSYEVTNNDIVIGRNEICDAYLHLKGEVVGETASGEYVRFGLGGGKQLGYFSLTKRTNR
jgi:hypothetical protein